MVLLAKMTVSLKFLLFHMKVSPSVSQQEVEEVHDEKRKNFKADEVKRRLVKFGFQIFHH